MVGLDNEEGDSDDNHDMFAAPDTFTIVSCQFLKLV